MNDKLKECEATYALAKKQHKVLRDNFLDQMDPKVRDRLKKAEHQRDLGQLARSINGTLGSKSVTHLEINGQTCTDHAEVEAKLLEVNANKIRASEDTPFLQEPLFSAFGPWDET